MRLKQFVHFCVTHHRKKKRFYHVYQRFRLNLDERSEMIILYHFWTLLMWETIFGGSWSFPEICSSLKPNHLIQIELVQIPDPHVREKKDSWILDSGILSYSNNCHPPFFSIKRILVIRGFAICVFDY